MTEREFISLLTDRGYVSHSPGVLCLPGVDRSEVLFTHTRAGVLGDWQSFEDALRRLGVDVPGDPTETLLPPPRTTRRSARGRRRREDPRLVPDPDVPAASRGAAVRPLLVGEDNPHGGDPRLALYPKPANSAGGRLRRILGLTVREYLRAFDRANLCAGGWDATCAQARADAIFLDRHDAPIVLLGARVCAAFRVGYEPFTAREATRTLRGLRGPDQRVDRLVIMLPHPSGRCRAWNDPGSTDRARTALREAGALW